MKWPKLMLLVRHDVSAYNVLREKKAKSRLYHEFLDFFTTDPTSEQTKALAVAVKAEFALGVGDAETTLLDIESHRAEEVGLALRTRHPLKLPHVIFVSPYRRTLLTLEGLKRGWPELGEVKVVVDERIREQEHGLANLYNDWRVFHILHPEQATLYGIEGPYWYRYPQGESIPDVRERNRSWINTVTRDFAEKRILVITHHLNILALRANLERWGAEKFIEIDENDKPINCGVTAYRGNPELGTNGRFQLEYYNRRLHKK